MKKLLLLLALGLALTGCGSDIQEGNPAAQEEMDAIETSVPAELSSGPIAVRTEKEVLTGFEGDFQLLTFEHDVTHVTIPGNLQAQDTINAFLAEQDGLFVNGDPDRENKDFPQGYEEVLEYARAAYLEQPEYMNTCYQSRSIQPIRAENSYLGLLEIVSNYMGGAHGNSSYCVYMLRPDNGQLLRLQDLTDDYDAFSRTVVDFMVKTANSRPDIQEKIAWFGPEAYEENFKTLLRDGSWCLNGRELCFFTQQYEFGPYAAGVVDFRMPIDLLEGLLKEEFYPAGMTDDGTLTLEPFQNQQVLDRIVRAQEAPSLVLRAEGTVYNLRLIVGSYLGEEFLYQNTLWYADALQDQALEIQTYLPDVASDLCVVYQTADGTIHRALLVQSGRDGSYFLQEDF